ncbi:hypothetical protein AA0112_g8803 [Alternaria arborescens]|uniref:hypothetical protein n=1 Tax=Alternaria arborescens TaxID=156630 RepID=UPI001074E552|nr:hypothetical protein AA0111_g1430 [Alternaria arborescens]RYN24859.1 hypothetical protein AA0112_g8803 [Alternaria arborescens]RYO40875.1 hypothetical protein AA0111_g1430 [Alternaria arborescens]
MAAVRPVSIRASEMTSSSSPSGKFRDQRALTQTTLHKRRTSASRSGVVFKSRTWNETTSKHHTTFKTRSTTSNKRTTSDSTSSVTATKQQSRFASLFISLLAVSPMAIEYDAADQQTMEAAQRPSVKTTQPTSSKKTQVRLSGSVRPSEIRKTRWKRFKYEMGLKMKSTGRGKAKDRRQRVQVADMELENLRA